MKVRALELGHDNVQLRVPGEEFELADEVALHGAASWFEPVDDKDKAKFEASRKKYEANRAAAIAGVNPAKQAAEYAKSVEDLAKTQAENEALKAELAALKKK